MRDLPLLRPATRLDVELVEDGVGRGLDSPNRTVWPKSVTAKSSISGAGSLGPREPCKRDDERLEVAAIEHEDPISAIDSPPDEQVLAVRRREHLGDLVRGQELHPLFAGDDEAEKRVEQLTSWRSRWSPLREPVSAAMCGMDRVPGAIQSACLQ